MTVNNSKLDPEKFTPVRRFELQIVRKSTGDSLKCFKAILMHCLGFETSGLQSSESKHYRINNFENRCTLGLLQSHKRVLTGFLSFEIFLASQPSDELQ